ncbi:MAG: HAD-IIA family hydrolase [Acidimicrobiales bacterium]|nr:HAD-IIA family hydrolase [Acidimicrobiales bacterium]
MLWVFDLDGVVWLAGHAIAGSPEAVRRLRDSKVGVAFVTNNSTPTVAEYVDRLAAAGIDIGPDELVTSAQAAASMIDPGTPVSYVGGGGVKEALENRGVELVPLDSGPKAIVVGRSLQLDFGQLAAAAGAIREGARFVATNTDATFPTPSGLEPGAGALVAYLEVGSGRRAEVAGKPHEPMAELVRGRFGQPDLVVGDRADTDGAFADRIGAPFGLVLTGVTKPGDLPISPEPATIGADLATVVDAQLKLAR